MGPRKLVVPGLLVLAPMRPGTLPVVPCWLPRFVLPPMNEFPLEELLLPKEELLPNMELPLLEGLPKDPLLLDGLPLPNELLLELLLVLLLVELWASTGAAASSTLAHANPRAVSRGSYLRMIAPLFVCPGISLLKVREPSRRIVDFRRFHCNDIPGILPQDVTP